MLALSILVVLVWIYLFALHSSFWRPRLIPVNKSTSAARVAVIVPARDEAAYIGACIRALLAQSFAGDLRIFLVDDHSSDATAAVARGAAVGHLSRLKVIEAPELPTGWTGKVWAQQQGWLAAQGFDPDYVWLTDADIVHEPDMLSRLIAQVENGKYELVSLMVRLHCEDLAERILIPAFVYFFFMLYPPLAIELRSRRIAGAAGGCMLMRSDAIEGMGGFAAIRSAVIDDCALAAMVKRNGGRIWLGLADSSRSIRPYEGWGGIRDMIARTAFSQLRHSALLLGGCVIGMALVFLAPVALLALAHGIASALAIAACVLMFATYAPMQRFYSQNVLYALTLPLAAVFYCYATVLSAIRYWRGEGGTWKQRVQDHG